VAALLSPVLWQMEHPDKFDMYSVGILMLQMAFPNLRSDNSLIAFNRRLQELGWDLKVGCGEGREGANWWFGAAGSRHQQGLLIDCQQAATAPTLGCMVLRHYITICSAPV
jgi:hypothetical protein